MRRGPEADPAPACDIELSTWLDGRISPMGIIIRGSAKSKRPSCATLVLSGVGRAKGNRFKIGSAVASDGPGAPVGLSCAATVETINRDTKAPEKNTRRVCLVVKINPPTFS